MSGDLASATKTILDCSCLLDHRKSHLSFANGSHPVEDIYALLTIYYKEIAILGEGKREQGTKRHLVTIR